jgi:hypothetical protein
MTYEGFGTARLEYERRLVKLGEMVVMGGLFNEAIFPGMRSMAGKILSRINVRKITDFPD